MAVNGGRGGTGLPIGTAVIGVTLAVAALVAALVVGASLRGLLTTPARYGVRWDVSLKTLDPAGMGDAGEQVVALPGVGAASILLGEGLVIDGEATWTIALEPLKGTSIAPVVSEGQAPVGTDEIALGALTQQDLGKHLGDTVTVSTNLSNTEKRRLLIVGTAVMNAIDEGSPGLGAVVTPALMHDLVPIEAGDAIVVDLTENTDGEAARVAIERDLTVGGNEFDPPRRQNAVRNVERIQSLPYLLAAVVALFAVASLAHALVLSVRRNRPQLAVLKTLGFTRRQVSAAVAWEASTLSLFAVAIGVPIGLLLARWGWGAVAERLGLASPTVVPVGLVVLDAAITATGVPVRRPWHVVESQVVGTGGSCAAGPATPRIDAPAGLLGREARWGHWTLPGTARLDGVTPACRAQVRSEERARLARPHAPWANSKTSMTHPILRTSRPMPRAMLDAKEAGPWATTSTRHADVATALHDG